MKGSIRLSVTFIRPDHFSEQAAAKYTCKGLQKYRLLWIEFGFWDRGCVLWLFGISLQRICIVTSDYLPFAF